jgi:signal transduction histidine kinase
MRHRLGSWATVGVRLSGRYGFALLMLALGNWIVEGPFRHLQQSMVPTVAMALALAVAWVAGLGPSLLAVGLAAWLTWREPTLERVLRHVALLGVSLGMILAIASLRAARRRVAALNDDLARKVAELEAVLDVLPVGVGIADDPECRSIRGNAELARALGLPPGANASLSAPVGQRPTNFRICRGGRELEPGDLPLQRAASGEPVRDLELDIVHDDGRVVTLLESAVPLRDADGRVRGGVGSFLDVTELKRSHEELVRAKEAAEAADRAKGLFLAMVSHELRTPLTPALLTASALLDDPTLPPTLREPLEEVLRGVELEARLVDDLLDVTRAGAGKLRVERRPVDAHAVLRRALAACRDRLRAAGVRLAAELAPGPAWLRADPDRLQQVAWNLVQNAGKFTPPGGLVTVRTRVEPPGPDGAGRFVMEVVDTGEGIEPETLARIFEPFEQGGAGLARPSGLGLGLAIARTIALAHGGELSARSDGPGTGSTFTLVLPAEPVPEPPAEPARPERPARPSPAGAATEGWPRRLLLVEDDAATARVLARLLALRGTEVSTAASLAAARAAAESACFDLVVSDLGLPDGNGLDLGRWLAARGGPPAIALSGYGAEADVLESRAAGFAAHLTKPVTFATLESAILGLAAEGVGRS